MSYTYERETLVILHCCCAAIKLFIHIKYIYYTRDAVRSQCTRQPLGRHCPNLPSREQRPVNHKPRGFRRKKRK